MDGLLEGSVFAYVAMYALLKDNWAEPEAEDQQLEGCCKIQHTDTEQLFVYRIMSMLRPRFNPVQLQQDMVLKQYMVCLKE